MDYQNFKKLFIKNDEIEDLEVEDSDFQNLSEKDFINGKGEFKNEMDNIIKRQEQNLVVNFLPENLDQNIFFNYLKINDENPIKYIDYLLKLRSEYNLKFKNFNNNLELQKHTQRQNDESLIQIQSKIPIFLRPLFEKHLLPIIFNSGSVVKDILEKSENEFQRQKEEVLRIINNEIQTEKEKLNLLRFQPQQPTATAMETPELDFSDNSDKVKLIMLEKLGIIDYIKTIQTKPDTISHTSEILSAITGIESKTLNSYLYPMLRPYRDDDDKNSPYKNPENLLKAETELIKLKIKNTDDNR